MDILRSADVVGRYCRRPLYTPYDTLPHLSDRLFGRPLGPPHGLPDRAHREPTRPPVPRGPELGGEPPPAPGPEDVHRPLRTHETHPHHRLHQPLRYLHPAVVRPRHPDGHGVA